MTRRGLCFLLVLLLAVPACAAREAGPDARRSSCSDPLGLYTDPAITSCCDGHDVAYRAGGTEQDRLRADVALMVCVRDRGFARDAESMFMAVRLFGRPRFKYSGGLE
jgi:hypothetical protein